MFGRATIRLGSGSHSSLFSVFAGAVTYRVVQVTPNEDGQPQLVAGLPSNQVRCLASKWLI